MSNNFTPSGYSGKNSPCPICGRTKDKDCRWNETIVLCHSYIDQDAQIQGYLYKGNTDGLWGKYLLDTSTKKAIRPKSSREYFYPARDSSPLVKVKRVDNGNGAKSFYQFHWDGKAWVKGLPDTVRPHITIYRYQEVRKAIAAGKPVFMVEGESCADALWDLGIPATTTLGGSKKYRAYGTYSQDLADADLILCPDRDELGMAHMEDIAQDFPTAQWCYCYPDSPAWSNLPKNGGLDVADWITDGATDADIAQAVGPKRINGEVPDPEQLEQQGQSLTELASYANEQIDLSKVFHPVLADALNRKAASLPVSPEYLMQPFLSVNSGLIGAKARIRLKQGWTEPAILWTGLIGEPGTMKSPAIAAIQGPLVALQIEARDQFNAAQQDYDQQLRDWDAKTKEEKAHASPDEIPSKPPSMRHYYMDKFTTEALIEKHAQETSQNGFSLILDELAGLFTGMDQYKSGTKGDSRQILLTLWTGGALKSDRITKELFIPRSSISITGGIQRKVLEKLMSDPDDPDGMWGRFLWADPPIVPDEWVDIECDISHLLGGIYQRLDEMPATEYKLSAEAKAAYKEYVNQLAAQKPESSDALKNVLSKLKGYAARIAMVLHCIDRAFDPSIPQTTEVDVATLNRAFYLCSYYLRQVKLLHARTPHSDLPPDLLRIMELANEHPENWIEDRLLVQRRRAKDITQARELILQLSHMGVVDIDRNGGKTLKLKPKSVAFVATSATNSNTDSVSVPDQFVANSAEGIFFEDAKKTTLPEFATKHPETQTQRGRASVATTATNATTATKPKTAQLSHTSPTIGAKVNKKKATGWTGKIVDLDGDRAQVLWNLEKHPEWLPLSELKVPPQERPFQPNDRIKNPAGWTGYVNRYDPVNNRVYVTFNGGIDDDYPPSMLQLIEEAETKQGSPLTVGDRVELDLILNSKPVTVQGRVIQPTHYIPGTAVVEYTHSDRSVQVQVPIAKARRVEPCQ